MHKSEHNAIECTVKKPFHLLKSLIHFIDSAENNVHDRGFKVRQLPHVAIFLYEIWRN